MTFDQVLVKLRGDDTRRFRRKSWGAEQTDAHVVRRSKNHVAVPMVVGGGGRYYPDSSMINGVDLAADDWEEVEA